MKKRIWIYGMLACFYLALALTIIHNRIISSDIVLYFVAVFFFLSCILAVANIIYAVVLFAQGKDCGRGFLRTALIAKCFIIPIHWITLLLIISAILLLSLPFLAPLGLMLLPAVLIMCGFGYLVLLSSSANSIGLLIRLCKNHQISLLKCIICSLLLLTYLDLLVSIYLFVNQRKRKHLPPSAIVHQSINEAE